MSEPTPEAMEAARAVLALGHEKETTRFYDIAALYDFAYAAGERVERARCLRLVEYGRGAAWTAAAIREDQP